MPTVFLNGSSPNYAGFEFTTAIQLIDQLETTLVSAGWTSVTKVSGTSLFVKGTTTVNNHNCWIEFVVSGTTPALTLTMRGWLEQAKTNGSPNSIHTATFSEGTTNRLWLTADSEAGCFCIYNGSSGTSTGCHFGFLIRVDPSDQWAWMVGRIHTSGLLYAYSAKSYINSTIWRQLIADHGSGSSVDPPISTSVASSVPLSTWDKIKRIGMSSSSGLSYSVAGNTSYSGYLAYNGGRNYNNQAVIDTYSYLEGRGAGTYGSGGNNNLIYRGDVKFAYCGVASESAVSQIVDPVSGNRILSVGLVGWQGMRIL